MNPLRLLTAICLAALLLVPITGCQSTAEKAAEKAAGVEVDKDGNKVTVTGKDGEKVEVQGGDDLTLPEGFPKDVPVYENATITSSSSVSSGGKTMYTVGYETADEVKTVHNYYKTQLPKDGWTIEGESLVSGSGQTTGGIGAKKGQASLNVASGRNEGESKTTISLIVTK